MDDSIPVNLSACFEPGPRALVLKNLSFSSGILNDEELRKRAAERLERCDDPLEQLRLSCLSKGTATLKGLGRYLQREYARDGRAVVLNAEEFAVGLVNYGLVKGQSLAHAAFDKIRERTGAGNQQERLALGQLLNAIRPPMGPTRMALVSRAFDKMDIGGNGVVRVEALKSAYLYKNNPKYASGEKTREELLHQFFDKSFDLSVHSDTGLVSKEDFINFYTALSMGIQNDINFDHIVRNSWPVD